jgi:hypothetical protein
MYLNLNPQLKVQYEQHVLASLTQYHRQSCAEFMESARRNNALHLSHLRHVVFLCTQYLTSLLPSSIAKIIDLSLLVVAVKLSEVTLVWPVNEAPVRPITTLAPGQEEYAP